MDVVGDDREYEWTVDGQHWVQNAQGIFNLREMNGQTVADSLDLDFLAGARPAPDGKGFLPAAFSHCPRTGKLLPPVAYDARCRWLPPYGNGTGRRVIESSCGFDAAQHILASLLDRIGTSAQRNLNDHATPIAAPRKNGLSFMVANLGGHRQALFALDREGGLFLWQSRAEQWRTLLPDAAPIGRSSLPSWAWGVALRNVGERQHLILAGEEGACEISVDPLRGRYRLERCLGQALAAPGTLEDRLLVPQRLPGGHLCLVERTADGWLEHPITGADPTLIGLSAPLSQPSSRRLLWIGEHGYLSVKIGEQVEAQWLRWPQGARAQPEYGPPFVDGYGTWQQLFDEQGQYCLRLDSDERKEVRGSRLGTGHLSFKFKARLEAPWAENDEYTNPATRDVIYPFIEFSDAQCLLSFYVKETSGLQKLFEQDQPIDSEYRLERIGEPPLALFLKVAQPWNAQWFFFDNALWLYIDSSGALYRWNV
ncbi:hypothetical protein G7009_19700 [Pseudomonas capeferrum]|uniref:hypothetical protein n=1 Tax=Pseudomonas capeferrum TaxID=1495066 RepID=UPI0015E38F9B|nr:hypothetical protein [Pseudomonas capeferrum]MBA1203950.1 hypothetical protein [Pseudomonas capeferrum]